MIQSLETLHDYAGELLKCFVSEFANIYCKEQVVYNVHSLLHLTSFVKKFGCLQDVWAFQFENYLGKEFTKET